MKKAIVALAGLALTGFAFGQANDTLAKIKGSGKVVMGVRDSSVGTSYALGDNKYAGYHVELCERILKAVVPTAKVEYTVVTSANRIPLVQNGTVDIECGTTTNNTARKEQVSFALTTLVTEVRMAVRANSGITSITQLNGKNVATTTGTTSVQTLRKNEKANGIDFKEIYGKDHSDSFLLLEAGRADAFVMDDNILAGNIANSKNPADFKLAGEVLNVEPIAIMFRKDDPAFKKAVDDQIRGMMKSGDLAKLYAKWYTSPIPPKNSNLNLAMGDTLKALIANPNDNPMETYAKK
ncbi:MAG: transporter substrate-binding domain-containing protein [Betaproteobacteria bacterium]|nr:transporter substrate-binding domain-containing protein [Betaproteobacteria bacterium]MBK7657297.1 transporter substrate-binding domain-containing protein [Betaproteobacteria bacterium]MBP6645704.1 transporter substrate-binding domain-containing protein [Burkholderiaceae bacterium]